jgi:hypothetical protein
MEDNFKNKYVLLAAEMYNDEMGSYKTYGELKAVSGFDRDGQLMTVEASYDNAVQFFCFDRTTSELADFMKKYSRQQEFSDDYIFFQVYSGKCIKLKEGLEGLLAGHHNSECREMLKKYEVNPCDFKDKPQAIKEDKKRSRGLKM